MSNVGSPKGPHIRTTAMRLPWIEPLLPPCIHVAAVWVWAKISGHEDPYAVFAWQLVAFPLLAFVAVATMSPLLKLAYGRMRSSTLPASPFWLLGLSMSLVASYAAFAIHQTAVALPAVWLISFGAALSFFAARARRDMVR